MEKPKRIDNRKRYLLTLDPDVKDILTRYRAVTKSPTSVIINTLIRENIPALEFIIKTHQALSSGKICDKEATLKLIEQVNSTLNDNFKGIENAYMSLSEIENNGYKYD